MKNSNKSSKNISKNFKENTIPSNNKSPIATCVAAALFIFGSSSVIADPDHEGIVAGELILTEGQQAVNSIINENYSLTLDDDAIAQHTTVNTGGAFKLEYGSNADITSVVGGALTLSDYSKANINTISAGGRVEVNDNATIIDTVISSDTKEKSSIQLYQDGTAKKTKVGHDGALHLSGNSRAQDTHISEGGYLFVHSNSQGATLENTRIEGKLIVESDVILEGKTEFTSNAALETSGHLIDNQGELIFNSDKNIIISGTIDGPGSLTKENPATTLTLSSTQGPGIANYTYTGDTNINAGNLKLSNTNFYGSAIHGQQKTSVILDNSILDATVQGSNVVIGESSEWNMLGDSKINNLVISETGRHNLNNNNEVGNQLTIDGYYYSTGGTLIFHTMLEEDDSATDHMLVKGDTYGHTNVKVININGNGGQTDSGIKLIEVEGTSNGEFIQSGRITAGAYEYHLGRGEGELSSNWYLNSNIEDYEFKDIPEAKLPAALPPKQTDDKNFLAELASDTTQAAGGAVGSSVLLNDASTLADENAELVNTPKLTDADQKRANAKAFSAKLADLALQTVGGAFDSFTQPEATPPRNAPELTQATVQTAGGAVGSSILLKDASTSADENAELVNTPKLTDADQKRANAKAFSAKLADLALQTVGGAVDSFIQPEATPSRNTPELTRGAVGSSALLNDASTLADENAELVNTPKLVDLALQTAGGAVDSSAPLNDASTLADENAELVNTPAPAAKLNDDIQQPERNVANIVGSTEKTEQIETAPGNTLETAAASAPKTAKAVAGTSKSVTAATSAPKVAKTVTRVHTPENGSYIANIAMARNLFTTRLENRTGQYQYKDVVTGQWQPTSMWMHTQAGKNRFGNTVDQLNIKGKYYSVQLGGDIVQWATNEQDSGRIGVLAGLGKATNDSNSKVTNYYSRGSVDGYNLGIYATWFADKQNNTGLYIDTLAQYSWFNNTVNGQGKAEEKYKSSGFTTSVESGYTFNVANTEQFGYFIQPNAQLTWIGINAQTHNTADSSVVSYRYNGQLVTRIGAKAYLQTHETLNTQFTPFVAVNWVHQNHNTGTLISGQGVENNASNSAEFKVGVESQIDQQLHIWANINHQVGSYNYSDTNALVGVKYHF